jgi:hypothetical protein
MRVVLVYLARMLLAGLGCALVLHLCYPKPTEYDRHLGNSYVVVCGVLAACALLSWMVRARQSRRAEYLSSATIALVLSFLLIWISELLNFVDGMPWQYFYKDDYILVFQLIAPLTVAILTGALALSLSALVNFDAAHEGPRC